MKVIKLGGSLFASPVLLSWLEALTQAARREPIIIVPGGGPFADQVRLAQQRHDIGDGAAHCMAILAMAQFGLLLHDLAPRSRPLHYPCPSAGGAHDVGLHIWLPDAALFNQPGLPQSWAITADSLALWLAQQLEADALFLIKRRIPQQHTLSQLCRDGVIDQGFNTLLSASPLPVYLLHDSGHGQFPHQRMPLQ